MQQTFYIESDEEIISVIGKLRKSPGELNYFVFPKRALVLQSIVNLRLLQREAEKLGKKIVLVTQDEIGKNLALKVGIETENYSDDFSDKAGHLELTSSAAPAGSPAANMPALADISRPRTIPRSDSIGSSDYNAIRPPQASAPAPAPVQPTEIPAKNDDRKLRVRSAGPLGLTSLNSQRGPEQPPQVQASFSPPRYFDAPSAPTAPAAPLTPAQPAAPSSMPDPLAPRQTGAPRPPQAQAPRNSRLEKFFSPQSSGAAAAQPRPQVSAPQPPRAEGVKKARGIFILLGTLTLASMLGVGFYLFFPKAEIHLTPFETTRTINMELQGSTGAFVSGERNVPVRLLEREREVSFTVEATGKSANSNQKARGTITIYNSFSPDPQPLVATTRFEGPEGKIFRLVEGVTVPGMKGSDPGSVEAAVIADQSGAAYNIAPAAFTVPGFKGSSKYEKFTARSTQAMIGGGDGGSEMTAISKADLDRAQSEAQDRIKKEFLAEVSGELAGGEKILESHMEVAVVGTQALLPEGTLASSFDYRNRFKVRAFVIPEETLRTEALKQGRTTIEEIEFEPKTVVLSYENSKPNFSEGKIDLNVRAVLTLESVIDAEALQERVLGQNEEGIEQVLAEFPGIKKIEVRFDPQGLISTIPKNKDRVTIIREPGEE